MSIFEEIQTARNQQMRWDGNSKGREFLVVIFQLLAEITASDIPPRASLIMLAAVIVAWIESVA